MRHTHMKVRHILVLTAALAVSACGGEEVGLPDSTATTVIPTTTVAPATTVVATTRIVSTTTTVARHLVSGYAHAGPTCPVVQNPPDPRCDDRAVVDALLVVFDRDGEAVAEVRTDAEGLFAVHLTAGTYTLTPQAVAGLLGTAQAQEFTVGPGAAPDLDVAYDTGIR